MPKGARRPAARGEPRTIPIEPATDRNRLAATSSSGTGPLELMCRLRPDVPPTRSSSAAWVDVDGVVGGVQGYGSAGEREQGEVAVEDAAAVGGNGGGVVVDRS